MNVKTTTFTPQETEIPGLIIFKLEYPSDERGFFQEKFQEAKLRAAGLPNSFKIVQNSWSHNNQRGVTRGFHAEPWDKYIGVIRGRVFAAYVDLRKGPDFGRKVTVEIDGDTTVFLPEGVANSFQTLTDDVDYFYSVPKHWSPEDLGKYVYLNLADQTAAIDWPVPLEESIMSDADKKHPMLSEIEPMEV